MSRVTHADVDHLESVVDRLDGIGKLISEIDEKYGLSDAAAMPTAVQSGHIGDDFDDDREWIHDSDIGAR